MWNTSSGRGPISTMIVATSRSFLSPASNGFSRFFTILSGWADLCIPLFSRSAGPVGPVCPASPPNLGREFLTFFLGCFVDDLPASVMLASGVLQRGPSVLRERARAWVVLPVSYTHLRAHE